MVFGSRRLLFQVLGREKALRRVRDLKGHPEKGEFFLLLRWERKKSAQVTGGQDNHRVSCGTRKF